MSMYASSLLSGLRLPITRQIFLSSSCWITFLSADA